MQNTNISHKPGGTLSASSLFTWRIIQVIAWLIGAGIFILLLFLPKAGLLIFWNILIPVAPALLVVAPGLWRNVCPLATTNLLPRHFNLSKKKKMPVALQSKLQLVAVIALFIILPARHLLLNNNGQATALLLLAAVITGVSMGFIYDWKSGWCNSLCPIHPVEKLYGSNTGYTMPNAHCGHCVNCSVPCPDSTPNFHPAIPRKNIYQYLAGLFTIGGLPGFIFGWFCVPDKTGPRRFLTFFDAYAIPLLGFCITITLYQLLEKLVGGKHQRLLVNCFAAASVACYYWFRIPALLGFRVFAADGALADLRGVLPAWGVALMTTATTLFFVWWLVYRKPNHKSWTIRPKHAERHALTGSRAF